MGEVTNKYYFKIETEIEKLSKMLNEQLKKLDPLDNRILRISQEIDVLINSYTKQIIE